MEKQFLRTSLLIGEHALEKLKNSRAAVFGIGGVGSFAAEALIRAGVGAIDIFDGDVVDITNINRQLIADFKTIGLPKAEVMKKRMASINPSAVINARCVYFNKETENSFDFSVYNYVIDCIDMVSSKLLIIEKAKKSNIPVISCMGTGNKLDPTAFEIADISKTSVCPLAKIMRKELKKRGINNLKVLYSKEKPMCTASLKDDSGKIINASISFVPSAAGLIISAEVIKDLIK